VKAVLSGVGGDEWFSGYPVTRRMAYAARHPLGRAGAIGGRIAARLDGLLPEGRFRQRAHNLAMRRSPLAIWIHSHGVFRHDQVRQMLGLPRDPFGQIEQFERHLAELRPDFERETPAGLSCLLDYSVYMGSQLLRDSDVMSMKHSLELRTPLVDVEIVKFSRTCRDEYKIRPDGGPGGGGFGGGPRGSIRKRREAGVDSRLARRAAAGHHDAPQARFRVAGGPLAANRSA